MPLTADSGSTVNGEAAPIFSALASTKVSAARRASVRFIAASSASPVVSPVSWWTPVTPSRNRSAVTVCGRLAGGGSAGDHGVLEQPAARAGRSRSRGGRPGPTATVGLWVTTVARRSRGSAWATIRAVVPPSRMSVLPGRTSPAAAAATRRLLSTADVRPGGVVRDGRRHGQRAAVHPLAEPGGRELAQVAADAVLRQAELGGQVLGDQPPLGAQPARAAGRVRWAASMHVLPCSCRVLHYSGTRDLTDADPHRRPVPLRHRRRPRPDGAEPGPAGGGGVAGVPQRARADDRGVGGAAGAAQRRRGRRRSTRWPSR